MYERYKHCTETYRRDSSTPQFNDDQNFTLLTTRKVCAYKHSDRLIEKEVKSSGLFQKPQWGYMKEHQWNNIWYDTAVNTIHQAPRQAAVKAWYCRHWKETPRTHRPIEVTRTSLTFRGHGRAVKSGLSSSCALLVAERHSAGMSAQQNMYSIRCKRPGFSRSISFTFCATPPSR